MRTIKSFDRPVILVDDLMHPGVRIKALDPVLRQEGVDIQLVLVGILSGYGRDLMSQQKRPVDSVYFLPSLRQWFVEATLYPFIGGNTVRRSRPPVPGLLPGINHILPYAVPPFAKECGGGRLPTLPLLPGVRPGCDRHPGREYRAPTAGI